MSSNKFDSFNLNQVAETKRARTTSNRRTMNKKIKIEYEKNSYDENLMNSILSETDTENTKKKSMITGIDNVDESKSWMPKNWQLTLENIKDMRRFSNAPVDTMGGSKLSDSSESPNTVRFQILTALLLSSQTKDEMTALAVERLKAHGLNIRSILNTTESEIGKLISNAGFWKKKSQYLKRCAQICLEEFNGDIPNTFNGLKSLPGIGPKMAHIIMSEAWGEFTGIGVDTHVHRVVNRLKWVQKPTKTAEETRRELESWLPPEEKKEIAILLVGFGQEICKPIRPNCEDCSNKKICPSSLQRK